MRIQGIIILGLLSIMMLPTALQAQRPYFPFFQQEWFFGNHPSARTAAMGKADVAVGGSLTSLVYNPAGIGRITDWQANASTSAPFYVLGESDYLFGGYAKKVTDNLTAGLTFHQFAIGPTTFDFNVNGSRYPTDAPRVDNLTATAAYELIPNLIVGVNAHYFSWKVFDEVNSFKAAIFDAGLLYTRQLNSSTQLRAGAALVNAGFGQISFEAPDGNAGSNFFPAIGRAGVALQHNTSMAVPGIDDIPVGILVTTEFQDLLNSDIRTAFRVGGEAVFANAFALRLGFFTQSEDDMGVANNRDRVNDLTYGFGFIVPFNEITEGTLPFTMFIDYLSLRNPPLIVSGPRRPNKRTFTIRIAAPLTPIQ